MKNIIGALGISLALAGCGSGGNNSGEIVSPPPSQSPGPPRAEGLSADAGGIWRQDSTGTSPPANDEFFALVSEDGRIRFVVMGHDSSIVSDTSINRTPFKGTGQFYAGGAYVFGISYWGAVAPRSALGFYFTSAWDDEGRYHLKYDASLYEISSSLETLAGLWTGLDDNGQPWLDVEINADGSFTGMDYWGCTSSGQFAITDSRYNLYDAFDVTSDCDLGTEHFSGLAFLPDASTAADFRLFASLDNGSEARRLTIHRN